MGATMKRRLRKKRWKQEKNAEAGRKLTLREIRLWPFFSDYNRRHGLVQRETDYICRTRPYIFDMMPPVVQDRILRLYGAFPPDRGPIVFGLDRNVPSTRLAGYRPR
jgi:hypothetical protein